MKRLFLLLMAGLAACSTPEQMYVEEKAAFQNDRKAVGPARFDSAGMASLPPLWQQYLRVAGFENQPVHQGATIVWEQSFLKLGMNREWGELKTEQYNHVQPLARSSWMQFQSMPLSGRDLYRDGYGEMNGKLFHRLRLIHANNRAVAQSSLVTVFSEMMLVPGALFHPQVKWQQINEKVVEGTLSDGGFTVKAKFYFDEDGLCRKFESFDRFYDAGKGVYQKQPFYIFIDSYKVQNGLRLPYAMRAVWQLPEEGAFEYYRGKVGKVVFD